MEMVVRRLMNQDVRLLDSFKLIFILKRERGRGNFQLKDIGTPSQELLKKLLQEEGLKVTSIW